MRTINLLGLILALAISTLEGSARADSITTYKQKMDRIATNWTETMSLQGIELAVTVAKIDVLMKIDPRPLTYELQLATFGAKILEIKTSMEILTKIANTEFGLTKFESSDEKQVKEANDYANKVAGRLKAVAAGVSVQPSIKAANQKGRSGVIEIHITFFK
jgi:hypothetical protein